MIEKNTKVRQLQLGASNLIGDDTWRMLFKTRGPQLQSLMLSELNDSFNDETVDEMAQYCRQLQRLKLRTCLKLQEPSLTSISCMTTLEHLTLAVGQDASSETLVTVIQSLGPSLKTLCLETYAEADDAVLAAIHTNCNKLSKLRLTGSVVCSDGGFANLFTKWGNAPLQYIDLSDNRDLDNANPDGPAETPVGLGSEGFRALMHHSGSRLGRVNVHSCRHISHEALSEAFDGRVQYPLLKDVDLSFVTVVDDFIMTGIFKELSQSGQAGRLCMLQSQRRPNPSWSGGHRSSQRTGCCGCQRWWWYW